MIICGEPSGDLLAASLAKGIKDLLPAVVISGVGGKFMQEAKAEVFCQIKNLSVIGLFDALKKLPRFFALQKSILDKIKAENPDAIVLVDFSGFNLRLARKINKTIPVVYYVSPQVWASRPGRINTIRKYIDKMVVLFDFENEFYKKHGITAEFAGHPLLDIVRAKAEKDIFLGGLNLAKDKLTIALLPGSRRAEIKNILPVMIKAAGMIKAKIPNTQFVIAKATQLSEDIYEPFIKSQGIELKLVEGKTYDCLNNADFSLVCSGTATLEAAIIGNPFAVIYKMSLLNYFLYRPQVKLPCIGMVNIVAGKRIIPEFIQFQAKASDIAEEAVKTLTDPARINQIRQELAEVKKRLGEPGASLRAAKIIIKFLESKKNY